MSDLAHRYGESHYDELYEAVLEGSAPAAVVTSRRPTSRRPEHNKVEQLFYDRYEATFGKPPPATFYKTKQFKDFRDLKTEGKVQEIPDA